MRVESAGITDRQVRADLDCVLCPPLVPARPRLLQGDIRLRRIIKVEDGRASRLFGTKTWYKGQKVGIGDENQASKPARRKRRPPRSRRYGRGTDLTRPRHRRYRASAHPPRLLVRRPASRATRTRYAPRFGYASRLPVTPTPRSIASSTTLCVTR